MENWKDLLPFFLFRFRCGSTLSVFFLEVGRFTATGAGEIWMDTFDPMIANNMSEIILQ